MKLKAKSARGKQLLKQWGAEWEIIRKSPTQFSEGIWWYIAPSNKARGVISSSPDACRWMHPYDDKHLEIDDPAMDILKNQPGLGR